MVFQYVNFGYPDTVLVALAGFPLTDFSPIDGMLRVIIIDSPSEFVEIRCFINEIQILPQEGGITIRTSIPYPINRSVKQKDRLVVELDNHDPANPHTPSMTWDIEEPSFEKDIGEVT